MSDLPAAFETGWFEDEEALGRLVVEKNGAELISTYRSLLRADIAGLRSGAVASSIEMARGDDQAKALFAIVEALKNPELVSWVEADATRRARAEALALRIAPPDPSIEQNIHSLETLNAFTEWNAYPFSLIIVPGYTPLDTKIAKPNVHPVCRRRLEKAQADFLAKKAPFVLVSGGNVYPRGTRYYEALEMKSALLSMGFPSGRILVDARARHSTTNLRNAGRMMVGHGLSRALITTRGGGVGGSDIFDQDFYFSNPTLSTFYGRCERELGYRVGTLADGGDSHTIYEPSKSVTRINWRDPLDP